MDVGVVLQGVVIGVTSGLLLAIFQLATQLLSRKIRSGQQTRKVTACYTQFQEQVLNPTDLPGRGRKLVRKNPTLTMACAWLSTRGFKERWIGRV